MTPTEDLYNNTKYFPIRYYLELEQCKQMYRILSHQLKCNIDLTLNENVHNYTTRARENLHVEVMRTNKAVFSPVNRLIHVYNTLPQSIKQENLYQRFLIKLKKHLQEREYI